MNIQLNIKNTDNNELTNEEKAVIRETNEESKRIGNFERTFPNE